MPTPTPTPRSTNVFRLVRRESPESSGQLIGMALLAGISNAMVLGLINAGTANVAGPEAAHLRLFLMFLTVLGLFILTKHFILTRSILLAERIINDIRVRLANKVRHAELSKIEALGRGEIYNRITAETIKISEAAPVIIDSCQYGIMIFFSVVYIAILSRTALLLTVVLVASGMLYYFAQRKAIDKALHHSTRKEVQFFDAITDVLDGWKELKVNRGRSDEVFTRLEEISRDTRDLKTMTGVKFAQVLIFSQCFFYILIGVNVFILPRLSLTHTGQVVQLTAAILFIVGPLTAIVTSIQTFAIANVAIANIDHLEAQLGDVDPNPPVAVPISDFSSVAFRGLQFAYRGGDGAELFRVGPVDFEVRKGEVLFIVGGNGSGKSTLMKLLTGLYQPDAGSIEIDGRPLEARALPSYRELFAIIFADYHLFARPYAPDGADEARVKELLTLMQLGGKTSFAGDRFTNTDLSGGQKKRLALVAAILEDKPVYVFDEWAADQDPAFRKLFYEEILADFKRRGKTVIAVTHDDKYFGLADRVLKMDYGRLLDQPRT